MTEITNTHHFNQNVKLIITDDDKYLWYCKDKLLDPTNSLNDFVAQINIVFRVTGVCFDVDYSQTYTNYFAGTSHSESLDIIKKIYQQPLERKIQFVHIGSCRCNMGNCGATTSIDVDENNYMTYGDVMQLIGIDLEIDGDVYYGYPDSVMLELKPINQLPTKIHSGNSCYSDLIDVDKVLEPDTVYLSWGYYR